MPVLRLALLAGCAAAVGLPLRFAHWRGEMAAGTTTYQIDLDYHPVWDPPPPPQYPDFRAAFGRDNPSFPPPPGGRIDRTWDDGEAAVWGLLLLWLSTAAVGLVYLAARGGRRDAVLHLAASAGAGLTVAVAACLLLWCVGGGWGPPAPLFLGAVGLFGGLARGLVTLRRHRRSAVLVTHADRRDPKPGGESGPRAAANA